MNYVTKDKRDVFIYDFETKSKELVISFSNKDGLISHMKFLGDYLFYVRNTKDVIVKQFLVNSYRNMTLRISHQC